MVPFNGYGHREVDAACQRDLGNGQGPGHQVEVDPGSQVPLAELWQAEDQDHEDDVGLEKVEKVAL